MKGIVYDLTFAEYVAIPAVNWSTLRYLDVSGAEYRYRLKNGRDDTPALSTGRAAHCAVLEPDQFLVRYAVWTGGARRGKDWLDFQAANADRDAILTESEYDECLDMRDAVRRNRDTRKLVTAGRSEVSIVWTDRATGIRCKARIDKLSRKWFADFKTTRTIDARRFGYQAADLLWYGQLAFYAGGIATLGMDREAKIVAVEKTAPYDCGVFELDNDALYAGEVIVSRLLTRLAECKRTRRWPGRFKGPQTLQLPGWAYGEDYEISSAEVL